MCCWRSELSLEPDGDLRQDVVFLVILRRDEAAVIVGERDVEEESFGELGLQLGDAVDEQVVDVEQRGLDKRAVVQSEALGQLYTKAALIE